MRLHQIAETYGGLLRKFIKFVSAITERNQIMERERFVIENAIERHND